jgi:serine/threonine protein kinase
MTTEPRLVGGRYEILELLGRGGSADVHRARDVSRRRDVALKVLREVTDADRDRFAVEAQLLALLSHQSIVTLFGADVTGDHPWLALELVRGRSLAQVRQASPMEPRTLAAVATQVAGGLAHAHARGVVHRDVKPSNVLITSTFSARLTDFGIARRVGSSQLTESGHVAGTVAYIAPEQVRGEQVDGAADVYALGLLLLEALTGQRSFDGPPIEAALARLHHAPDIPASLDPRWADLLASMTSIRPEDRPTAVTAALYLQDLADGGRLGGSSPASHRDA